MSSTVPSVRVQRQREMERRSMVLAALRPDPAAVELDEPLADRQSQARPARAARDGVVQLLERLEQAREVLLADADPGVGPADPPRSRLRRGASPHPPPRPGL